MREIEAKLKIDGHADLAQRLRQLGAQPQGRVVQRDTFFDRPDHSLRCGDVGLRLRQETASPDQPPRQRLTFKGPRDRDSQYKARLEIEFGVDDGHKARIFLENLGYQVTLAFEKRREVYLWRECTICLDEVILLGRFVEIEGPCESAVTAVRDALDLAATPLVAESYAVMLAEHLERQDLPRHEYFF